MAKLISAETLATIEKEVGRINVDYDIVQKCATATDHPRVNVGMQHVALGDMKAGCEALLKILQDIEKGEKK